MDQILVSVPSTVAPVTSPQSPITSPVRLYQTPNTLGLGRCSVCSYVFPAAHSYLECLLCLNSTCNTKSCSPRRHKIEHEMSILFVKQDPPAPSSPFNCTICATQIQSSYFCDDCDYCICRDCWRREEAPKNHKHKTYTVKEALDLPRSSYAKPIDGEKRIEMPITPPETPLETFEETEAPLSKAELAEALYVTPSEDILHQPMSASEAVESAESSREDDGIGDFVSTSDDQAMAVKTPISESKEPVDPVDQPDASERPTNVPTEDTEKQAATLSNTEKDAELLAVNRTQIEPVDIVKQSVPATENHQSQTSPKQKCKDPRMEIIEEKVSLLSLSSGSIRSGESKECVLKTENIERSYPEVATGPRGPLTPPETLFDHHFSSEDDDEKTLAEHEAFELYSPGYFGAFGNDRKPSMPSHEPGFPSSLTPPPLQPRTVQRKPISASFVPPTSPTPRIPITPPTSTVTPVSAASPVPATSPRFFATPMADHYATCAPIPMSGPLSMSPPLSTTPTSTGLHPIYSAPSTADPGPNPHVAHTKRASTMPNTNTALARMQALAGTQQLYSPASIQRTEQANSRTQRASYSSPNYSSTGAQPPVGTMHGIGTVPSLPATQTTSWNHSTDHRRTFSQPSIGQPPVRPMNISNPLPAGSDSADTRPQAPMSQGQIDPRQMPQSTLTSNSWKNTAQGQSRGLSNFKNKGRKIKISKKILKNKKFWKGALVGTKLVLKITNIALNQTTGIDLGDAIDGLFDGVLGGDDIGVDSVAVEDLGVDGLGDDDEMVDAVVVEDESGEEVYVETDVQDVAGLGVMTDTTVFQDGFGDTYVDQEVVATDAYGDTYMTETTMATDAYGDTYTTETTMATDAYGDVYTSETTMATDAYGDSYMTENTTISDPSTGTYVSESSLYENSPYGSYMAGAFTAQDVTYGGY